MCGCVSSPRGGNRRAACGQLAGGRRSGRVGELRQAPDLLRGEYRACGEVVRASCAWWGCGLVHNGGFVVSNGLRWDLMVIGLR
ncbi:hypothetical protein E2C01_087608 [Portunus trituberculatus]|uniref:Uncharacterized protein n=1 Tax=Portunus trituberculatus TaxID=210409 RepID=A0A5B7JEI2_PORTR|nr:hypothetical protein [Portunus trituberculatus]